jgi:hypothetical protein
MSLEFFGWVHRRVSSCGRSGLIGLAAVVASLAALHATEIPPRARTGVANTRPVHAKWSFRRSHATSWRTRCIRSHVVDRYLPGPSDCPDVIPSALLSITVLMLKTGMAGMFLELAEFLRSGN